MHTEDVNSDPTTKFPRPPRAAAIAFAREGADAALSYFPDEEPDAQEVVTQIRAAGRKAVLVPGGIRSEVH
jgi:hypothetical protein